MTENALRLTVQCYAGHRADEALQRFFLGERKVEVIETLDRWLDPDHEYFKVRGDDQSVYILRHDVAAGRWELTMFER